MDCGWENQEREARNRSEYLRSLASNADRIERAVPPQTSGMRGVPFLFAMFALQPTSGVPPNTVSHRSDSNATSSRFKLHHRDGWRNLAITVTIPVLSEIAFHEKAGRSQVGSFVFSLTPCFSSAESPLSPPFHPHSLMSDFCSLGASWVFSFSAGAAA